MSEPVWSFAEVIARFEQDRDEIRRIYSGHPLTAPLAAQIAPTRRLEEVFAVAVVGRMRLGKSTLINALLERDLALTGVNETTATVNWFRYAAPEDCGRFRVHWKGRPAEFFPLDRAPEWLGTSELACDADHLDFYSDSPYLRVADIVDTPGSGSVIDSHEETLHGFVGGRTATVAGEREARGADAVVYVLPFEARESDEALLGEFEASTRVPGSMPHNSLGVLHKWDALNSDDPMADARRKARTLGERLAPLLSEVLAVSAPLYRAASYPAGFWDAVWRLARESSAAAFDALLVSPKDFERRPVAGAPLSPPERAALRADHAALPWPSLRLILRLVRAGHHSLPAEAREAVCRASGMEELKMALQRRFFDRVRVIQLFSAAAGVLEPCRRASLKLQAERDRLTRSWRAGEALLAKLTALPVNSPFPTREAADYVRAATERDRRSLAAVEDAVVRGDEILLRMSEQHRLVDADLHALTLLDTPDAALPAAVATRLRTLFGQQGTSPLERLAWTAAFPGSPLRAVQDFLGELREIRYVLPGDAKALAEHAIERLELLAAELRAVPLTSAPTTIPRA